MQNERTSYELSVRPIQWKRRQQQQRGTVNAVCIHYTTQYNIVFPVRQPIYVFAEAVPNFTPFFLHLLFQYAH